MRHQSKAPVVAGHVEDEEEDEWEDEWDSVPDEVAAARRQTQAVSHM